MLEIEELRIELETKEADLAEIERGLEIATRRQLELDEEKASEAGETAYRSMLLAAKALVSELVPHIKDDADLIVSEFRARFYDTKIFYDPFAKGKFANYLFKAHEEGDMKLDIDLARQRIEEAQLFIEAAFACHMRMGS